MRIVKIVGIALGALVVLIAAALTAVWLFVNPNDYKGRIEQIVKRSTGRELELPGTIRISVFPWVALELGPASLGNPPGFGTGPFASVRHAALRVRLLPLLHKQLQIGRVEIDGLDLRLAKNAAGKGNWEDFGGGGPATGATSSTGALPDLAGLLVKSGRISYQGLVLDHVSLDVGHLGEGIAVPVKLSLDVTTKPGAAPFGLGANFDFTPDTAKKRFRFATLELKGTLHPRNDGATVNWDFSAPDSSVDLAAGTATVPHFTLHFADARVTGKLAAEKLLKSPAATGALRLDPVALRELLDHLGVSLPRTRDAKAFGRVSAAGDFAYGANALRFSGLDVQLDDSHVRGDAAITDLATHAATFDLALDRIDIDRYLSPDPGSAAPAASKRAATDPLKTLRLDGKVSIGSAKLDGIALSRVRIGVAAKDGVARIAPANAQLYGGSAAGDITFDDRGATPALKITQSLTNIDVAPLLQDFAKTKRLSGRGNVTATLTARGSGADAVLRTLNGHVAANLADGAIEGIDLWSTVNSAVTAIQQRSLPAGAGGSGRTKFDAFKASADITNGVAATKDLVITSQNLHVTGQGTTNLVTRAIDYRIQAAVLKSPAGAGAQTLADVPVTITGTLADPKVRPDLEGLAKARVQKEVDKRKEELKKKLEDKLKGLFGH